MLGTSLDDICFRSERVASDVLVSPKGTVEVVLVATTPLVTWPSISLLHATESPNFMPLAFFRIQSFGGATIIAIVPNAVSVINVHGRTFDIVTQTALGQQSFVMRMLASYTGSPFFRQILNSLCSFPHVVVHDSSLSAVASSSVVLLSLSFPKTEALPGTSTQDDMSVTFASRTKLQLKVHAQRKHALCTYRTHTRRKHTGRTHTEHTQGTQISLLCPESF